MVVVMMVGGRFFQSSIEMKERKEKKHLTKQIVYYEASRTH